MTRPHHLTPPLSAAQRDYVDAFMAWVREPSPVNLFRRRLALDDVMAERPRRPSDDGFA